MLHCSAAVDSGTVDVCNVVTSMASLWDPMDCTYNVPTNALKLIERGVVLRVQSIFCRN